MPVLAATRTRFEELWEHENRLIPVEVTSAIELDEQTVGDIGKRIGEQTGHKVQLTSRVDPDIIGGIVLRVGNSILDASIRNRLDQLRKEVVRAA
jgi:ATP synthase F1 delta subunit